MAREPAGHVVLKGLVASIKEGSIGVSILGHDARREDFDIVAEVGSSMLLYHIQAQAPW